MPHLLRHRVSLLGWGISKHVVRYRVWAKVSEGQGVHDWVNGFTWPIYRRICRARIDLWRSPMKSNEGAGSIAGWSMGVTILVNPRRRERVKGWKQGRFGCRLLFWLFWSRPASIELRCAGFCQSFTGRFHWWEMSDRLVSDCDWRWVIGFCHW
jgi:hypothetical protein